MKAVNIFYSANGTPPRSSSVALLIIFAILLCYAPIGLADTQVLAWGRDPFGETNVPPNLTNAVSVAAGGWESTAIRADGSLVIWGLESSPPAEATNLVATASQVDVILALRADGTVFSWGNSAHVPAGLSNAVCIAAGSFFGLAGKSDGTVAAWGDNSYGQLFVPAGLSNVVSVACGDYHGLALKGDGTVVAWGWDTSGQTNVPAGLSNVVAISATYSESLALKSDGSVVVWGGFTNVPANVTNVVAIASGENHNIALRSDGSVVPWGDNSYGESDVPEGVSNVMAIGAGVQHNVVLMGGGSPQFFRQPASVTVPGGFSYVFAAQATGTVPLRYQWQLNGTNIPGATAATLLLTNIQYSAQGLYSVVASNVNAAVPSSNAQLTVVPAIITSQPTDSTVFGGDTVTFAVSALGTDLAYAWSSNSIAIPAQTNSSLTFSNVTVSEAATYSVLLTNVYGSVQSSNAQLTVIPLSITTQPADQTVFEASDVSFAVAAVNNGPFSYQWQFNGDRLAGETNATLILRAVSTNQAGTYSVLVSNPYGSQLSSSALLTVNLPFLTSQPADAAVFGGDGLTFAVSAVGAGLSYQWQFNGTNLPTATDTTLVLTAITTNAAGSYSVLVSNPYRTLSTSNATLTVTPLGISSQPASRSAYIGDSAMFSVAAVKNGPFSYQWQFYGTNLPGRTDASLTLTNLATSDSGDYSVIVANPYGSVQSLPATLNVLDSKPVILTQPVARGAYLTGAASFQVTADGTKPLSYQWLFNGKDLPGATSATLLLTNLVATNGGLYAVRITNSVGSTMSSNAQLVFLNVATWGGTNSYGLANVPLDLTNAVAVAAGNSHSVALKANGRVVAWGYNFNGQTDVPANLSNVVAIAAAWDHTLALRSNGTVVAWGNGGINVPAGLSNVIAIAAGDYHGLALESNGTVVAWGDRVVNIAATNVPANLSNVIAIAAGASFSAALKSDGTVTVFGSGPPTSGMTNVVAIAGNEFPLMALKADRTVAGGPTSLSNVVAVAPARYDYFALKADGTVVNWTSGNPTTFPWPTNVVVLASGQNHRLAILGDGQPPAPVPFTNPKRISSSFSLTVPTQYGHMYWLDYKTSLADTNWRALPLNPGLGSTLTLTDSSATNAQRFYRIRQSPVLHQ